jgi:hypothetical protein
LSPTKYEVRRIGQFAKLVITEQQEPMMELWFHSLACFQKCIHLRIRSLVDANITNYVIDGFVARFGTNDGTKLLAKASGSSGPKHCNTRQASH